MGFEARNRITQIIRKREKFKFCIKCISSLTLMMVDFSCEILSYHLLSHVHLFATFWTGSSVCGIFQVRILEWVAIFLLQGIFLIQGSKTNLLCLLHCRQILNPLSHWGNHFVILKVLSTYPIIDTNCSLLACNLPQTPRLASPPLFC